MTYEGPQRFCESESQSSTNEVKRFIFQAPLLHFWSFIISNDFSSCMSLPFSSQLPSVITISLTYERKNIYRTFFATTNFQLQIMYSTGAKETVGRVGLNIQFMANLVAVLLGLPFYFLPTQISNTSLTTALYYKSGFKNIIFGFVSYYMYYA